MVITRTLLMTQMIQKFLVMAMMTIIKTPNETSPFIPGSASTPGPNGVEEIPMQTKSHEKSGLPEASYTETSFGGRRNVTDEEIERRLNSLRNPLTGVLDITTVDPNESLLSLEDQKKKEIERVKDYTKKIYPNAKFWGEGEANGLNFKFSSKKPMELVVIEPRLGET